MGAPLTHFFSLSLLTQVEGFSCLEIIASFSNHGSSFTGDNSSIFLNQIVLAFHPQVMMGCMRCLQTWIDRYNVLL